MFPARARSGGRLETIAIAVGICLPIPLLAATGLSMPLPNVVERIAAGLVPWADPVAFDTAELQGSSGTIVTTAAETESSPAGASPRVQGTVATPSAPAAKRSGPAPQTGTTLERTPGSRPVATAGGATAPAAPTTATAPAAPTAAPSAAPGEVDRTGTAAPAAGGDAPAPAPRTETQPTTPPPSDSGPTTPPPALPAPPTQSNPPVTPALPVPVPPQVPAAVDEVVDEVATVLADPVGTIVADPVGTLGGIVKTPLLPGLGGK